MSSKLTISLADSPATYHLGQRLGALLSPGSIILLEGDLGAGKTTLVQGLGAGLEIPENIESPTFTLINEYHSGRIPLYHLDLYRLEPSEVEQLNIELYWEGIEVTPGITAIEWAERLPYQPDDFIKIGLKHQDDGSRLAEIIYPESLQLKL
ncbi:tRNA (adenosine(37)-N6)-threonylcarbamoyltransferase complex ATPase subunit type 1 TsaE [Lyngbya aestuarii]|uniref:tRNA (adenosine(37)-N6)-threonylcarbamoyltransferase complex ATPase subunit type 1 TsaE n=1 Tax=Lyngbya aestuarii TaxID=118322 RepID=UPI00058B84B2|nr:tRNA (adenosine(37)-N6)-threonylcarbamoyltransferase complex ATPase subunit type 1 TsaE [Lyngbya aestuarii]